jgi:hypothetical protein
MNLLLHGDWDSEKLAATTCWVKSPILGKLWGTEVLPSTVPRQALGSLPCWTAKIRWGLMGMEGISRQFSSVKIWSWEQVKIISSP